MNVIYIVAQFPSKSEYFILNEILELEKVGYRIIILANGRENYNTKKNNTSENIYYCSLGHVLIGNLQTVIFQFKKFCSIWKIGWTEGIFKFKDYFINLKNIFLTIGYYYRIKNLEFNHIHAHFAFLPTKIAFYLSHLLNIPFSFSLHARDIYANDIRRLGFEIEKALFVITCTQFNKRFLSKLFPNSCRKIFHIYHGIDFSSWKFVERFHINNPIRILCIGRLVEKKGIDYLLEALVLLKQERVEFSCIIIGEGSLLNQYASFIKKNKLEQKVQFLRSLPNSSLEKYYHNADIFILPCIKTKDGDQDGLPNVLLESFATGLPVITTNVSAINELVLDKQTGIIIPERNSDSIVKQIKFLTSNPLLYNSISKNARHKIEQDFRIEESTVRISDLFQGTY